MSETQRRYPRLEFVPLPWVFRLHLKQPAQENVPLRVEARNISCCGMKFVSNRRIPLFETVEVTLLDKETGRQSASLHGKVVRLEEVDTGMGERTYGIALEFSDDSTEKLLGLLPPENVSGT